MSFPDAGDEFFEDLFFSLPWISPVGLWIRSLRALGHEEAADAIRDVVGDEGAFPQPTHNHNPF